MKCIALALLLMTAPAFSQTPAQWLGQKFYFGFYDEGPDRATIGTVLDEMKGKPGFDEIILGRADLIRRFLATTETRIAPAFRDLPNLPGWDHWLDIYAWNFTLVDEERRPWHPIKFLEPEVSLTLMQLGFWYCDNHDKDMPDAECYRIEEEAKALYDRIEQRALKP
jgi:hypothetical protein